MAFKSMPCGKCLLLQSKQNIAKAFYSFIGTAVRGSLMKNRRFAYPVAGLLLCPGRDTSRCRSRSRRVRVGDASSRLRARVYPDSAPSFRHSDGTPLLRRAPPTFRMASCLRRSPAGSEHDSPSVKATASRAATSMSNRHEASSRRMDHLRDSRNAFLRTWFRLPSTAARVTRSTSRPNIPLSSSCIRTTSNRVRLASDRN